MTDGQLPLVAECCPQPSLASRGGSRKLMRGFFDTQKFERRVKIQQEQSEPYVFILVALLPLQSRTLLGARGLLGFRVQSSCVECEIVAAAS